MLLFIICLFFILPILLPILAAIYDSVSTRMLFAETKRVPSDRNHELRGN